MSDSGTDEEPGCYRQVVDRNAFYSFSPWSHPETANARESRADLDQEGKDLLQEFICSECKKNPHCVILDCDYGHSFCKSCVERLQEQAEHRCPSCRYVVRMRDLDLDNFDRIRERHEKVVGRDSVAPCPWCNSLEPMTFLSTHASGCQQRMVKCPLGDCAKIMSLLEYDQHHSSSCSEQMVRCRCGSFLKRKEMQVHQDFFCPMAEVPCTRCEARGLMRRDMDIHLQGGNGGISACSRVCPCEGCEAFLGIKLAPDYPAFIHKVTDDCRRFIQQQQHGKSRKRKAEE